MLEKGPTMVKDGVTIFRAAEEDMSQYGHVNSRNKKLMFQRMYVDDPDTGMIVKKLVYPAGCMIPWHTHDAAHGIYVIKGTLVCDDCTLSAGDFIWWDEGVEMEHGAGPDEDVELLFITNKPLNMNYLDR